MMRYLLVVWLVCLGCGAANAREASERLILVTVSQAHFRPHETPSLSLRRYPSSDRYRTPAHVRRTVSRIARSHALELVDGWPIPMLGVYCAVLEVPRALDIDVVLSALKANEVVESAQRMQTFQTLSGPARSLYDDPYLALQYGQSVEQIHAIHRITRGSGVRIAVIDSAVATKHPDLRGQIRIRRDFVAQGLGIPSGEIHGTAMAGLIVASPNNGLGIVGLAPEAEVLALRACWQASVTARGRCTSFSLLKAISAAVEAGVDLINMSLAGPRDVLLERAVNAALREDILVVAAVDPASPSDSFPAHVTGVLAVGRSGSANTEHLSTVPGGGYAFVDGPSVATARTTALVALLMSADDVGALARGALSPLLRDVVGVCEHELQGPVLLRTSGVAGLGLGCGRLTDGKVDVFDG